MLAIPFFPSLPFVAIVFTLAVQCFGHCMCPFVLITCKVMGAKLNKVKNKQSKGQIEGKRCQTMLNWVSGGLFGIPQW
jgi:hypothetical protein